MNSAWTLEGSFSHVEYASSWTVEHEPDDVLALNNPISSTRTMQYVADPSDPTGKSLGYSYLMLRSSILTPVSFTFSGMLATRLGPTSKIDEKP